MSKWTIHDPMFEGFAPINLDLTEQFALDALNKRTIIFYFQKNNPVRWMFDSKEQAIEALLRLTCLIK